MNRCLRTVAVSISIGLALAGCTDMQSRIQTSIDGTVMQSIVGRTYASVNITPPRLPFEPEREPPYGRLFSVTDLPSGSRIHRHLIRGVAQTTETNFLGLVQSDSQRYSYRLLYFLVDREGIVRATANGFWLGEGDRCVGYVGNIFRTCESSAALAEDVVFFDTLVKTSDGRGLEVWRSL